MFVLLQYTLARPLNHFLNYMWTAANFIIEGRMRRTLCTVDLRLRGSSLGKATYLLSLHELVATPDQLTQSPEIGSQTGNPSPTRTRWKNNVWNVFLTCLKVQQFLIKWKLNSLDKEYHIFLRSLCSYMYIIFIAKTKNQETFAITASLGRFDGYRESHSQNGMTATHLV